MKTKLLSLVAIASSVIAINSAHAIPMVTLTPSNADIKVGDTFDVTVGVSNIDASLGALFGWGFMVSPLSPLGSVSYQGATVLSPFLELENLGGSVIADDFTFSTSGEVSIDIATLSFLAVGPGVDSIAVEGDGAGIYGLYFEDPVEGNVSFSESLNVQVSSAASAVPDHSGFGGLELIALGGIVFASRFLFARAEAV